MKLAQLLIPVLLLTVFVGCKKEQRPEGLPDLYPLTIKIIQDGKPLEGANVTLITDDSALQRWPCGGNTNAEGIAKLNTYGFDGAPAGQFRVTVSKIETTGAQDQEASIQAMQQGASAPAEESFDLVDPIYKNLDKTPLTIEVAASKEGTTQEFDVGEAVREQIKM